MKHKKNSILFIWPKTYRCGVMPIVGQMYLATVLKKNGYAVRVVDENYTTQRYSKIIDKFSPDYIGLTIIAANIKENQEIIKVAKRKKIKVIIGGIYVSQRKDKIYDDFPEVDYAIYGDGEYALLKLLNKIAQQKALNNVPNLIYKNNKQIKVNDYTPIKELDSLPYPDYSLADICKIETYPLITSRGCPHKCIFCTIRIHAPEQYLRSADNLIAELNWAKDKYTAKEFTILDDAFGENKEKAKDFLRKLITNQLNLSWSSFNGIRISLLDNEMLRLIKDSKCSLLVLPLENLDQHVMKNVQKSITQKKVMEIISTCKKLKINLKSFIMIGLPFSSYKKDMAMLYFLKKWRIKVGPFLTVPYHNTILYDWVIKNANLLRDPINDSDGDFLDLLPYYEIKNYPAKEIRKAWVKAMCQSGYYGFRALKFDYFKKLRIVLFLILFYNFRHLPIFIYRLLIYFPSKALFTKAKF